MITPQLRGTPHKFVYFLSGLLLVLGGSGAWYVRHLFHAYTEVMEINVASVRAAEELEIGLREIQTTLYRFLANPNEDEKSRLAGLRQNTDVWIQEVTRLATTPTEQEVVTRLNAGYGKFFQVLDRALDPSRRSSLSETASVLDTMLLNEIIEPAHQYLDFNEATMADALTRQSVLLGPFTFAFLLIGLCGCFGGFIVGLLTSRQMKRSLVELNLPLTMAAGKLSEVVGPIRVDTSLDLMELRKVLELISVEVEKVVNQLQKSQQEIMRSEKLAAIGQLAAGTAHEIRNPLMSIKLLVQSALADIPGKNLNHEDLSLIDKEVLRLERTVKNLLEFARTPRPEQNSFRVSHLIEHCIRLVEGRARIQDIHIENDDRCPDQLVEGDFQQLQQVLINMMINSMDAMPQGGTIMVSAEIDMKTQSFDVSVLDTGSGIRGDILPLIFDPFVSSKDSGTGLGLSICKQIIDAHGGRIFARNRQPSGAAVGFSLPLTFREEVN